MKCANINCRTEISNLSNLIECPLCQEYCCSNNCKVIHKSTFHRINILKNIDNNSDNNNIYPSIKNPLLQSAAPSLSPLSKNIFIKNGIILENFVQEPIYSLSNFEFIRSKKNNKIIGCGFGAYGEVLLAKNIKNNLQYAIKLIKKKNLIEAKQNTNIVYREIQIHSLLIHPNIIRLYSYKEEKENFFLIMEYAKKGSLFSKIRKEGKIKEKEAFKYFIQVSSALYFLHSNGYAHRDIKPENILIDENDNVKLCDFGWCVSLNDGQRKTFCGTFEYIAPEMIKDQPYNQSIDVWSLGVLLFEILHGYSPFRALNDKFNNDDNYKEIFKNIIQREYKIDNQLSLSQECIDMIHKLLEFDSKKRIKTPEIFLHPWVKKFEVIYKNNHNTFIDNNNVINENEDNSPLHKSVNSNLNNEDEKKCKVNNDQLVKSEIVSIKEDNVFEKAMKKVSQKKKKVIRGEGALKNKNDNLINNIKKVEIDDINNIKKVEIGDINVIKNVEIEDIKEEELKDKTNINQNNNNNQEGFSIFRQSFLEPINNNLNAPLSINNNYNYGNNLNDNNNYNNDIFKSNISNNNDLDYFIKPIERNKNLRSKTYVENYKEINEVLKNEKNFIESTPTPDDDFSGKVYENKYNKKNNDVQNAILLFEKADILNKAQDVKHKKIILKSPESFWDKLLKPFKCGLNNNDDKKN